MLPAVAGAQYRTLDDRLPAPVFTSRAEWDARAAYVREHILASAGLLPLPDRTPLNPVVFDELKRDGYTVSKVYFESLPGFFVTGNLYRPLGQGPFPAVLSAHGHWTYGRFENSPARLGPRACHHPRAPGLCRLLVRHDRLQRQPPVDAHVRRPSRAPVGIEPGRAAALEQHAQRRLPGVAAVREARRHRHHRGVRRRHADLHAGGLRRARGRGRARQHDLPAHAGRLSVREPAGIAARDQQRRNRRHDRAAADADDLGHRRLDERNPRGGIPGRARALHPGRRGRPRPRRPLHRRAQLQQGQPRGHVRLDGALAEGRAVGGPDTRAVVHPGRPARPPGVPWPAAARPCGHGRSTDAFVDRRRPAATG